MKALVLVNSSAGAGKALRKWRAIAPRLEGIFQGPARVYDETSDWRKLIREAVENGAALVVAAGGDGTVHKVANLLLSFPGRKRSEVLLGAVGLGSSNDFHRPMNRNHQVMGVPVRCTCDGAIRQNVLRVEYLDDQGAEHVEHAVTSCSLGMVALGNDLFNRRWGPLGLCRKLSPGAGIWCASLASLARRQSVPLRLHVDGEPVYAGRACLVGAYVNRHFAGGLAYPRQGGGLSPGMAITLLPEAGIFRRLRLLALAARTGLPGPPHTQSWQASRCRIVLARPELLEMDGEVVSAREISIRLLPAALRVCR